ncbi:MAG TPA: cytochrome c [Longimicrobiaceae bacterium]|nr:cytochrome c [Longimicrobiaceae bacterium]
MSSRRRYRTPAATVRRGLAGALALGSLSLAGCTDAAGYDLDRAMGELSWLATMREGVQFDPYEGGPRLPAPGSIPVQSPHGPSTPVFAQTQLDSVAATLRSPYPVSPALLARGELQYQRNCSVCHGEQGAGDGSVVGPNKFPYAPAINGAATQGRSDGYLYGVIRVGRGLMPPYGSRMSEADMWAVVAYMRRLQGVAEPATDAPQVSGAERAGPALTDTLIAPSSTVAPAPASREP